MKIYFAKPIFTPGEREWNDKAEKLLNEAGFEMSDWPEPDRDDPRSRAKRVFDGCFAGVSQAQALLAILSGTEVDDGTAAEVGIFYAMMHGDHSKRGVVGLVDDWRTDTDSDHVQGKGLNDFVAGCFRKSGGLVHTLQDAVERLKAWKVEIEAGTVARPAIPPPSKSAHLDRSPRLKVYFAAPQYTPYARQFVASQAQELRDRGLAVYVPRERVRTDPPLMNPEEVFDKDYAELAQADVLLALMDGTQPDDATTLEIGLFYGLAQRDKAKKGLLGYVTDSRALRRREHGYGCNHFPVGVVLELGMVHDDWGKVVQQLEVWNQEVLGSRP